MAGIFQPEANTVFGSGVGSVFATPGTDAASPSLTFGPGQAASPLAQALLQRQAEMMGQLGIPGELASPEAARGANEAALAKLATVNPELAQQLADNMTGDPTDRGFFDHAKDLVGDIMAPALAIGGKVLDILVRPSQIIPELIVDEEDDPWWTDVGEALSGNSDVHGSDVMEKWGVDNNVMKGVLGFAFDVVADPLTWLTFGGAGFGRALLSRTAGRTVAEDFLSTSLAKAGVSLVGGDSALVAQRLVRDALGKRFNRDAAEGIAALTVEGVDERLVSAAIEAGDHISRAVSTRTLHKMPKKMYLESLGKEVDTKQFVDILKNRRILGAEGKMAAGAIGGIRFRAFKYISPALPGTERLGFGAVSNFFRGYSGTNRLMKTINRSELRVGDDMAKVVKDASNGAMASWTDFESFAMGGWKGLRESNEQLFHYLKGEMPGGSVMVPLAEAVGGITGHFTPHTWMMRGGGLLGHMAMQGNISARDGVMDFVTRYGYTLRGENHEVLRSQREVLKALDKVKLADTDKQRAVRWFIDATPDSVKDDLSGLEDWYTASVTNLEERHARGLLNDEQLAEKIGLLDQRKASITEKWSSFTPEERDAAWTVKKLLTQQREYANLHGARLRDVTSPTAKLAVIAREDADEYVRDGHKAAREKDLYYVPESNEYVTLKQRGFQPDTMRHSGGLGRGVVLTDNAPAGVRNEVTPDAVPVAVRLENPLVVDHRTGAPTEAGILDELKTEADNVLRQSPDKYGIAVDADDFEEVVAKKVDEMLTEALVKQGRDGVVEIAEDGSRRAVVFDTPDSSLISKAKVISQEAGERAIETQGYFGRRFSGNFSKWLNGVIGENDELRRMFREDQARKYLHLDIDQAEIRIKEDYRSKLIEVGNSRSGVEKNQIDKALQQLDQTDVFTVNPIEGLHRYTEHVAEHLAEKHLATLGSRMSRLSKLGAFGPGGAVQRNLYDFIEPADKLKMLDGIQVKAAKHFKDGGRAAQKALNLTVRRTQIDADEWARVRELATDAATPQRARQASRNFGHAIAKDIANARTELKSLRVELKAATKAGDSPTVRSLESIESDILEHEEMIKDMVSLASGKGHAAVVASPVARAFREEVEKSGRATEFVLTQAQKSAARISKADARVVRWETRVTDHINEINRLKTRYKTAVEDLRPAFKEVSEGEGVPAGWKRVQVKGLENTAMPEMVAHEFETAVRKHGLGGAHRFVRDVMNEWKRFSTIYWFGFHVRNNYGAMFNNFMGGAVKEDYRSALQSRAAIKGKDGPVPNELLDEWGIRYLVGNSLPDKPRWSDIAEMVSSSGITGSNVLHDTRNTIEQMQRAAKPTVVKDGAVHAAGRKAKGAAMKPASGYARKMEHLTEMTENLHRSAMFFAGLRQTGGDLYGARMATMMRHGDYADLTDFEFKVVKDIMPFYKWMRTNLPYQFHNLIENPAKHLTTVKAADVPFTAQGLDPDDERQKMPEWLRDAVAIPNPFDKNKEDGMNYMVADLPMADLHTGFNEYISAFLPTVRPFIESFAFEKSSFTKAPLEGSMKPLAAWANFPVMRELLVATGVAEEKDGQTFINDKYENVLQVMPIYARFRNWALADPKRVKNRFNTIASVMFGAQSRTLDDEDITAQERAFYYNEILPAIDRAKDMGVTFPAKDEVSEFIYSALGFTPPQDESQGGGVLPSPS